jgi:hypothetical protein
MVRESEMALSPNGNGDNSNKNQAAVEQQFELLGAIQVVSFSAYPPEVVPFGATTLSWQVKLPTTLHEPVSMIVDGKKSAAGATSGSVVATLTAGTQFALTASSTLVSRVIKTLAVTVDTSACKALGSTPVAASVLTAPLKQQLDGRFSGSSQFALRSGGTVVTPVDGGANIAVPLHLNIPDWFDAEMDITIQLGIWMAAVGAVSVQATRTDVHVTWTWLQDLAGCTSFGEKLSQSFMSEIVNNELVPLLAQQINGEVQSFAATQQKNDPQHRTFVLTSFSFGPDGLNFTVCPQGAGSPIAPGQRLTEVAR